MNNCFPCHMVIYAIFVCPTVCFMRWKVPVLIFLSEYPPSLWDILIMIMLLDQTVPRTWSKTWYLLKLMAFIQKLILILLVLWLIFYKTNNESCLESWQWVFTFTIADSDSSFDWHLLLWDHNHIFKIDSFCLTELCESLFFIVVQWTLWVWHKPLMKAGCRMFQLWIWHFNDIQVTTITSFIQTDYFRLQCLSTLDSLVPLVNQVFSQSFSVIKWILFSTW